MESGFEDSYQIPSALSVRSISLLLEMLEGKALVYEELKERYEISYSTFKRHIKEMRQIICFWMLIPI